LGDFGTLSGIAGIFGKNGAPVDRALLSALTHSLSYRGPDAREVWTDGSIGLGHTLLRTTRESGAERQPASYEGRFWITADARIDCRSELEASLEQAGVRTRQPLADCELILRAFAAWGEACVEHLRGDFAFAIWDKRERKLFCARDHFGIKPFYYAELGGAFWFSNTLNCLRMHPEFSGELHEAAIADFLLFGVNANSRTTTFREIQRLPPAHTLTITAQGMRVARYWSAPVDGETRYRHRHEYVENLQILLRAAVTDRMRSDQCAILLSGGLDSGSVATVARELALTQRPSPGLQAFTVTYSAENAIEEANFARKTAKFLSIPHEEIPLDHLEPFESFGDPELAFPEPMEDPFFMGLYEQFQAVSGHSRVALSGEGADNLMEFEMWPYTAGLLRRKKWARFLAVSAGYLRVRRFPWRGIRQRARKFLGRDEYTPTFPSWIAPDFSRRMKMEERWKEQNRGYAAATHPRLPKAHASMAIPQWQQLFEACDPGVTRNTVEVRYPFLDLRVVNYLLSLPPFPWFYEKMLLRESMAARLPEEVRTRRKVAFGSSPLTEKVARYQKELELKDGWSEEIREFVTCSKLAEPEKRGSGGVAPATLRPLCFNFWLQTARRLRYNIAAEARNG
jgi:asparagine synthase (glutamine-hydrolysing)